MNRLLFAMQHTIVKYVVALSSMSCYFQLNLSTKQVRSDFAVNCSANNVESDRATPTINTLSTDSPKTQSIKSHTQSPSLTGEKYNSYFLRLCNSSGRFFGYCNDSAIKTINFNNKPGVVVISDNKSDKISSNENVESGSIVNKKETMIRDNSSNCNGDNEDTEPTNDNINNEQNDDADVDDYDLANERILKYLKDHQVNERIIKVIQFILELDSSIDKEVKEFVKRLLKRMRFILEHQTFGEVDIKNELQTVIQSLVLDKNMKEKEKLKLKKKTQEMMSLEVKRMILGNNR